MRNKQIKSILHDLFGLYDWRNPLHTFPLKKKVEFDLLKDEIKGEDSLSEMFEIKRKWLLKRIKDLKGNLRDFEEVRFTIENNKQRLIISYKGEKFEEEHDYGEWIKKREKIKEHIKNLKPHDATKFLEDKK